MKELYSVDEILNAIDELQSNKNKKVKIEKNSSFNDKKNEISKQLEEIFGIFFSLYFRKFLL